MTERGATATMGARSIRFYVATALVGLAMVQPLHAAEKPLMTPVPQEQTSRSFMVAEGYSCSPRRTCSRIATCEEANWYLRNCSWGSKLDRDDDGYPCESGPC